MIEETIKLHGDLISRQEAIEAAQKIIDTYEAPVPGWSSNDIMSYEDGLMADGAKEVQKAIENISPKESKNGRWEASVNGTDYRVCSICGYERHAGTKYNFCPNCGIKMK